jgi:hypothetical protein
MATLSKMASTLLVMVAAIAAVAQQPLPTGIAPAPQDTTATSIDLNTPDLPLRDRDFFQQNLDKPTRFALIGEFSSTFDTNILGASQPGESGWISQISFLASLDKKWGHNDFRADYVPTIDTYFHYDNLNFVAHQYDQEFTHKFSARSDIEWSVGASRYSSRFFTTNDALRFGGLTLTLPDVQSFSGVSQLLVTNGATRLAFNHAASARDNWTLGVLGGASRLVPEGTVTISNPLAQSIQDAGVNFSWRHAVSAYTTFGVTTTAVYARQTGPSTHEISETIQGTFGQTIGRWKFELAGGPLLRQVPKNSPLLGGNTWAVDAGATRKIGHSEFRALYSRSLQVGFAGGSVVADDIGGMLKQNLSPRLYLALGGSYERSVFPSSNLNGFVTKVQTGYRLTRDFNAFASYCHGQQDAGGDLSALSYHRNQYSVGIAYNFSHLLSTGD